jgi:UDPglucose--hexose-1-phosphate uridylyltransferase
MNRPASQKRLHPYLREWVIFAPATDVRPWNGAVVRNDETVGPMHHPHCHLCPGTRRATGVENPRYTGTHVFDNDFASFTLGAEARGVCRVVCFDPRHNITLAEMAPTEIEGVLRTFSRQFQDLASIPGMDYVMLFENKGKEIGVSNPHPHGQIYATDFVPRIPWTMYESATTFLAQEARCLFCEVLAQELADGSRVVARNHHFTAFVPPFARFKYEVHIMPLRHMPFISWLDANELASLAEITSKVLKGYDTLFARRSPNITIYYNAPCKAGLDVTPWHFHIQFLPPLRAADKLKYLAGFESGGGNIVNPSLPEQSAEDLRRACLACGNGVVG